MSSSGNLDFYISAPSAPFRVLFLFRVYNYSYSSFPYRSPLKAPKVMNTLPPSTVASVVVNYDPDADQVCFTLNHDGIDYSFTLRPGTIILLLERTIENLVKPSVSGTNWSSLKTILHRDQFHLTVVTASGNIQVVLSAPELALVISPK